MTAKEKSEQLVCKMWNVDADAKIDCDMPWDYAKQCALIAVDEILSLFIAECEDTRYWNEVKSEIEKL